MDNASTALPAVVGAGLSQLPDHLRVPIEEALSSLAPFIALDSAEVFAAIAAAEHARAAADHTEHLADELEGALSAAVERERRRWISAIDVVGRPSASASDLDELAAVLGVDDPATTSAAFDDFMRDETTTLRLGPSAEDPSSATRSLEAIAKPASRTHYPDVGKRLADLVTPGRLAASNAGLWVLTREGPAVLLGDGSAVRLVDGVVHRGPAGLGKEDAAFALHVDRWATGQPPCLQAHAVAALAASMEARSAVIVAEPAALPGFLALGTSIATGDPPRSRLAEVYRLLRELASIEDVHQGAAVLLTLALECARVRLYLTRATTEPECPVIHVGQVRWCTLSDRPIFWMPAFPEDPDVVGGRDRPWTAGIPAAGALWEASSPALRLDPHWAAALVVVPGDPHVMCIDPAGGWSSLDVDYEAIVLSRRKHREPWLDALQALEEDVPQTIAAARKRAVEARELRARDNDVVGDSDGPRRETTEAKFSAAWVKRLAERYGYADDAAARIAGEAACRRGHYTRDEFLTVVGWKSNRTLPLAERNPAEAIVDATARALAADDEITRVVSLLALDGVGVPVASALLHFAYPDRYPILDFRALATLGTLTRRTSYTPDFWVDYLRQCQAIAKDAGVSIRELDKALWQASKEAAV